MSVHGLAHAAIQAQDYETTLEFYTQALDFRRGHHWSLPAFNLEKATMLISADGRTCLEIFDPRAVIPAQGRKPNAIEDITHGALLHLAFYVDNVQETYEKALAHGARTYVAPDTMQLGEPPLTVRNAVVHSPNGEVIEFLEYADFTRKES